MARFTVLLQSQPEKFYKKADPKIERALRKCFESLENNPFYQAGRIKRLQGFGDAVYRYRIGHLRIVYEVNVKDCTIGVLAILPRGDVYKKI